MLPQSVHLFHVRHTGFVHVHIFRELESHTEIKSGVSYPRHQHIDQSVVVSCVPHRKKIQRIQSHPLGEVTHQRMPRNRRHTTHIEVKRGLTKVFEQNLGLRSFDQQGELSTEQAFYTITLVDITGMFVRAPKIKSS